MKKETKKWFDDEEQEPGPEINFKKIDELNEEDLGGLLFTEEQILLILNQFPSDFSSKILKGQLITEAKVRQMVIAQAIGGSSEAQKLVEKWIQKIKLETI